MTAYPIALEPEAVIFEASAPGADGLISLPAWLFYECATENTTVQISASAIRTGFPAHAPRAFSRNGSTWGLLLEPAATNLATEQDFSAWSDVGTPVLSANATPTGTIENVDLLDNDAAGAEYKTHTVAAFSAGTYTLHAWSQLVAPPPTTRAYAPLLGETVPGFAGLVWIELTTVDGAWAYRSATATLSAPTAPTLYFIPRDFTGTDTGSLRLWGVQLEQRAYPTSFIGADNATFTRESSRTFGIGAVICPNGYYDIELVFRPIFARSEVGGNFNLIYFDANNRLWFDTSAGRLYLVVNGVTMTASSGFSWNAHQEVTIHIKHTANGRYVRVAGAASGNGIQTASALYQIPIPEFVYFFGDSLGVTEGFAVAKIDPHTTWTPFTASVTPKDLKTQAATERGIQRYRLRTAFFQPWLRSYVNQNQDIENALWEVILERLIWNAVGVQLDALGKLVGEVRFTTDDDEYRIAVFARIAINISNGLISDIYQIARLVLRFGLGEAVFHIDEYSTAIVVVTEQPITNDPNRAANYLYQGRAAGVRLFLVYLTDNLENSFTVSDTSTVSDSDQGLGHYGSTLYGGYLASIADGSKAP